jgi:hypothetical protein
MEAWQLLSSAGVANQTWKAADRLDRDDALQQLRLEEANRRAMAQEELARQGGLRTPVTLPDWQGMMAQVQQRGMNQVPTQRTAGGVPQGGAGVGVAAPVPEGTAGVPPETARGVGLQESVAEASTPLFRISSPSEYGPGGLGRLGNIGSGIGAAVSEVESALDRAIPSRAKHRQGVWEQRRAATEQELQEQQGLSSVGLAQETPQSTPSALTAPTAGLAPAGTVAPTLGGDASATVAVRGGGQPRLSGSDSTSGPVGQTLANAQANPNYIPQTIQTALQQRSLLEQAARFSSLSGDFNGYMEAALALQGMDETLWMLQGTQAMADLANLGDPTRLGMVMSHYFQQPFEYQMRSDGQLNVYVNGEFQTTLPMGVALANAQAVFDREYIARQQALNSEMDKILLKGEVDIAQEHVRGHYATQRANIAASAVGKSLASPKLQFHDGRFIFNDLEGGGGVYEVFPQTLDSDLGVRVAPPPERIDIPSMMEAIMGPQ